MCVLAGPIAVRTAADPEASPRWRTFSLVALVVLLVTLGLTYSRGGILSLLVALAVLVAIGPDRLRLTAYTVLGIAAAVPAYLVAVVRDDLTTDGVVQAERADDGLILLAALLAGIALAVYVGRRLRRARRRARPRAGGGAVRAARGTRWSRSAPRCSSLIGALAVSERGVTGTIEHQWDDFTTVKSDDQSDPSRVLRSNSGNRWVWWREAAGAFSDEPRQGLGRGLLPARPPPLPRRTTCPCARRTACRSSSSPRPAWSGRPWRSVASGCSAGPPPHGCGTRKGASAATSRRWRARRSRGASTCGSTGTRTSRA